MSEREENVPPVGEEIHMPDGSMQPLLVTIGITTLLLGLTTTWWLAVAGGILTVVTIGYWIRDARRDIEALPVHSDH